jgi:hypothetical protein
MPSFYYGVWDVFALLPIISDYAVMPRSCLPLAVLNLVATKEGKDASRVATPRR